MLAFDFACAFVRIKKKNAPKVPKTFPSLMIPGKLSHGEAWECCFTYLHREMFKHVKKSAHSKAFFQII